MATHAAMLKLIGGVSATKAMLLGRKGFVQHRVATSVGPVQVFEAWGGGQGPTWVFLHGFASQATDWYPLLVRMLPYCRRIIAIDLPGHGRSPVPARGLIAETMTPAMCDAILDRLNAPEVSADPVARNCVLVGNSMGGLGAIRVAQHAADRVVGLVLVSPAGAPMQQPEMDALLALFDLRDIRSALRFIDKLYVNGCSARYLSALAALAHLNRPHLQDLLKLYRQYTFIRAEELYDLPQTLLIWGDEDTFFPPSSRNFYCRSLQPEKTEVVTPARFGHTPFLIRAMKWPQ